MKKTINTIVLLFSLLPLAKSQTDTIPFTFNKHSNICVKARINNSDTLTLMFHSASSGITLTQAAVDKKLTLNADKSQNVHTWGGDAEARYSEGNTFIINQLKWEKQTIFINENSGPDTDGKFGYDYFENKILEIDYNNKRILVHAKMPAPKKTKEYQMMKMSIKRGTMYVAGSFKIGNAIYQDSFMFHTGYGGAILLDPKIGEQYKMQAQLETIATSELRDSYNNVFKIETKLLPTIKIGKRTLKNVPLSFAARSSEIPMKVFGNDLLKRFNVIFDFKNEAIYLKINDLEDVAYNVKKS
jgi:hypothetical protein